MSWFEQYGKNQYRKKEHNQHSSVFKVLCVFIFYLVVKRLVIKKDSVMKNLAMNHESRPSKLNSALQNWQIAYVDMERTWNPKFYKLLSVIIFLTITLTSTFFSYQYDNQP